MLFLIWVKKSSEIGIVSISAFLKDRALLIATSNNLFNSSLHPETSLRGLWGQVLKRHIFH